MATPFGHLPTVEDASVGSGSTQATQSSHHLNTSTSNSSNIQQPRMKRSPYLSVMSGSITGTTKEAEDLVAMLSRPTPGEAGGSRGNGLHGLAHPGTPDSTGAGGAGLGRSTFFNLKRPSSGGEDDSSFTMPSSTFNTVTPVSSAGGGFPDGTQDNARPLPSLRSSLRMGSRSDMKGLSNSATGGAANANQRPLPSLRSALRMSSRTDMKALTNSATAGSATANEMRKNTSVTFSNATKRASQMGIPEEQQQQGNARFIIGGQQGQQMGGQGQNPHVQFEQQLLQFQSQQQQQQSSLPKANYTAAMMMKKSQSIASPQFMLAHQNSLVSSSASERTTNDSFPMASDEANASSNNGGAEGNASFPIYFSKLPGPTTPAGLSTSTNNTSMHARTRSKSMSTFKNYAQNPLLAALIEEDTPGQQDNAIAHARPSSNKLNLTFREMLDEGDGNEGDLNLKSRNQQWKNFQSFSDRFGENNPMMAAAMNTQDDQGRTSPAKEGDGESISTAASTETNSIPLSGSKRTISPSSLASMGSEEPPKNPSGDRAFLQAALNGGGMPLARTMAGSHRAVVSVNDLAMLRRAAGRMKMNNPNDTAGDSSSRRPSQRLPGEMLGGNMLSRMSSVLSEGTDSPKDGISNSGLSPLAQMMAKNANNKSGGNAGGGGGGGDSFANSAQRELFFQKFNNAMSSSSNIRGMGSGMGNANPASTSPFGLSSFGESSNNIGSGVGGMGRRVRTVGAGLAYGRANMTSTIDYKNGFSLSKFDLRDLRRETSRLSEISVADSGGGGKGRNEEWDLS